MPNQTQQTILDQTKFEQANKIKADQNKPNHILAKPNKLSQVFMTCYPSQTTNYSKALQIFFHIRRAFSVSFKGSGVFRNA